MSSGKRLGPSDFDRIDRLVEECMPDLLDFFERQPLSLKRIDRIFFDALYRLARQWDTIPDHRSWLLETLEGFVQDELAGDRAGAEEAEKETCEDTAGEPEAPERDDDSEGSDPPRGTRSER